jgi:hypothetical protein
MHRRHLLASAVTLAGCALALAAAPAAVASGALPKVSVRVEGRTRTLLAAKVVQPTGAAVDKSGHSCSGDSGAGAFNLATRGHWSGTWSKSLSDYEVLKILGDTENYSVTKSYWELFVDDVPASSGICGVKLKAGERLLWAAVGASEKPGDPLSISVPRTAKESKEFKAKVVYYDAGGRTHPAAGVAVGFAGHRYRTNSAGRTVSLSAADTGRYTLTAAKRGYIRDEAVLTVTS